MKTTLSVEVIKVKGAGPIKKAFLKKEMGLDEGQHVGILDIEDVNAVMVFPYEIQGGLDPKMTMLINLIKQMSIVDPSEVAEVVQAVDGDDTQKGEE